MSTTVATANPAANLPDGTKIADDLIGTGTAPAVGDKIQYVKLDLGVTGSSSPVATSVPINDGGNSITVDGTVAVSGTTTVTGTVIANAGTGPWPVTDNAGSLTVDNAGTFAVQATDNVTQLGGLAINLGSGAAGTGTQRVILATDQPVVPISDNAGSLTVDGTVAVSSVGGTVTVSGTVTTTPPANASTNVAQLAGTATSVNSGVKDAGTLRVTLATDQVQLTNALKVDGSAATQPVSGTVTANAGTGPFPVSDNAGSLTVDNAGTFAVQATQAGTWTVQPGNTANTTAWLVSTKTDLTPSAPTAASVGVASAQALASNASRKGLYLVNTSNATISLGLGSAAVLNSGITLFPRQAFWMDEYCLDTGAVNAIASAAASNLAIQEIA